MLQGPLCASLLCMFGIIFLLHFSFSELSRKETNASEMRTLLVTVLLSIAVLTFCDFTCQGLPTIRPKFAAALRRFNYVRKSDPPPTSSPGCIHQGRFYPADSVISRNYHHDHIRNQLCVELYCNEHGLIVTSYIRNCS